MHILVIEDNPVAAKYLCKGLKEHLFIVSHACDGREALHLITEHTYDVIILDVMLPHIDGWELIKIIKTITPQTPVLFLTAKDAIEDRVKGLKLGAEDYLIKPFAFSELLARVQVILRRRLVMPNPENKLNVADLSVDLLKYQVIRSNQTIALTGKEFNLLLLFMRNISRPLSRTYIAEQVWDIHFDFDTNAIDVAVKRLREKMDRNFTPKLIHTIRGVGYVMDTESRQI